MKKHLLSLFAMASMVFASSCSQEEVISQSTGNEVKVTFTTELRNDVKSRGVGDDTDNVDQLIFAVYDEMGKEISLLRQSTHPDADGATKQITLTPDGEKQKATIDVVLVKGQTYKFAFWAQKKGFSAYTFNPETAEVTVNYLDRKANQREADAFFAGIPSHTVTGTFTMDVTLKRPFAQVNFLTSQEDIENARKAGFNPANSRIIVKNVAQTLKVLTGEVSNFNNAEVTFDYAALLKNESNKIEETTINSVSGNWKYLATAYFLPQNKSEETKINATMEIQAKDANKAVTKIVASDITAQRNYRTNIYGNLLTSNGTFNVLVDPDFEDDDHNVASGVYDVTKNSLDDLLTEHAADNTLTGDLIYNVSGYSDQTSVMVEIPAGMKDKVSSLTFNFTDIKDNATMSIADASGSEYNGTVILKNPADKTISELTIVLPDAHVNLAQGNYTNVNASTSSSTLVISNGATIGNLVVNKGNVEVEEGGELESIERGAENPYPVIVYLEEGTEKPTVNSGNEGGIIFSEEKESTGDYTINLDADLELGANTLILDKNTVINGNGFAVKSSATRVFRVTQSNIEVTLNNVNMVSRTVMQYPNDVRGISIDPNLQNIKLTLNNSSLDFTDASACDWAYAVNVSGNGTGHTVTVNGGTYEGANVINVHGAKNTIIVKDATLNCLYPENEVYYGACIWVLQNQESSVVAENNTFNGNNAIAFNLGQGTTLEENGNTDNTKLLKVKVEGGAMYYTLAEAIAAIETEGTIKVCKSFKSEAVQVPANKNITLNLNGKTITGTDNNTSGNFYLIDNRGTLTINGNGTINLTAKNNRNWNASSVVVANNPGGNLTIESGVVIEHLGGTDMAYGVDNLTNGKGTSAITTIDGATIKSPYRAIRQFLNGIEATNKLHVKSGTIEGANKSIWMQDPSKNANTGNLSVDANAQLKGDVYLTVTEGSTEWPVEVSIAAKALVEGSEVLTSNVPEGYEVVLNNGNYVVKKVVTKTAATLAELGTALKEAGAAGAGYTTIKITADIDMTGQIWTPIKIDGYNGADIVTVEGGGHTIKGLTAGLFAGGFAGGSGIVIKNLTIEDSQIVADNTQGYGAFVGCADSMDEITLINCHLKNSSIITPNNGADESRIGGLIGWTAGYNNQNDGPVDSYIKVQGCSVTGCTLKGAGSIGGIVGHAGANAATFTTIENCTVSNNTFTSTDDGDWRVGVVVGTANNGQCVIKNITESGNTLSQTGKTAPQGQSNLYGRFVPVGTGTLTIDGKTINK